MVHADYYGRIVGLTDDYPWMKRNAILDMLAPKSSGESIDVFGNIEVQDGSYLIGYACLFDLEVGNITGKNGNIFIESDVSFKEELKKISSIYHVKKSSRGVFLSH